MEVRVKPVGLIFAGERVPMRPSLKRYSLEEVIRNMLILRSKVSRRASAVISAFRY